MGNIKHNDELLRVHDDGFDVVFNCDNKHQNGVSYHAEKNGKKTKIDPEYAMAALVKKVSGAGWPADMPVPSAGGYGYTEPEKNVTESEHTFTNIKANTPHVIPTANAFLLEEDQLYDITINGVKYGRCPVHTGPNVNALYCGDLSENMPFEILTGLLPSSKIFGKVTFTTDGDKNFKVEKILGQEIHKINEKYLPEISPTDEVLENAKETGGIGWTKEIKESTTIVDGTFYCAGGNDSVELTNEYSLVEGQSYNVTFNGTEYNNLVAFDDGGLISIGGTYGEYNEYPFHIENGENSPYPLKFYTEMPGNYSLVITTILEGEVIHKIDEKYLPPEPEECRWPADMPLPAPDGFGWRHYLTKNSQVSETSGITTQNTMYLVQDLSEENLATIRAGLKQDNVGPWNFYEISCEFYSNNLQSWNPVEVSKYTTTKYEDSGENYYAERGYQRFHMIFDRTKLSDEDAALFPKNGIYFEYHRNKAPTSISKARSAIYLKNGDPCRYSKIGDALYVKSSDGTKVMKITVASDGTITATEA